MKMKQKKKPSRRIELRAEPIKPLEVELRGEAKFVAVDAAKGETKGPRKFTMTAYTGGPMRPHCDPPLKHPVVIDLAGLDLSKQSRPALKDHDTKSLVGHSNRIETDGKSLTAEGVVSGASAAAKEVVESSDNGFQWPISLGAEISKLELVGEGKTAKVNGREVSGPTYIARASRPREFSFLTLAADDDTVSTIAAEAAHKGEAMSFTDWLKANGFQTEAELTDGAKTILRAAFDASKGAELDDGQKTHLQACIATVKAKPKTAKEIAAAFKAAAAEANGDTNEDGNGETPSAMVELKSMLEGIRREQAVYRQCGEKHAELAAKAIASKWDDETLNLAIEAADLRASLPQSMQVRGKRAKDAPTEGVILEAACAISGGLDNIEKKFDEKALSEAASRFRNGISLQELLLTAAQANGYTGHNVRQDVRGVLEHAFKMQAAQFSTISLPGIFANTANKFLLEGFSFVENFWREIASRRSVNDFKAITSYRLTGDATYEEVGPGGEIPHGTLGEESFTNQAKTYGKMYGITFQDIRNDDMNVLTSIPRKLGRDGAKTLVSRFWAVFLDNASFFADPSQNYLKGATTDLGAVGLGLAMAKWRQKADPDGEPLSLTPKILLVPPALEVTALELMRSTNFNTGGAATGAQIPNANIWANRFTVIVSDYLASETATTYYLLADPRDIPTIEVAFLDGKEQPTVETADADFNTLGVLMRGTFHFGVAKQDARGGLKIKGAA